MLRGHQAGLSGPQTLTLSAGPLFLSWALAGSRLGVDAFSVNVVLPYSDDPETRTPRDIKVISSISDSPLDIHCILLYIYKEHTHSSLQRCFIPPITTRNIFVRIRDLLRYHQFYEPSL